MKVYIKFDKSKGIPKKEEKLRDRRFKALLEFLRLNEGRIFESKKELNEIIRENIDVGFGKYPYAVTGFLTKARLQDYLELINPIFLQGYSELVDFICF